MDKDFANRVVAFLKSQEPWRPTDLHLYSPEQVKNAILSVQKGMTTFGEALKKGYPPEDESCA